MEYLFIYLLQIADTINNFSFFPILACILSFLVMLAFIFTEIIIRFSEYTEKKERQYAKIFRKASIKIFFLLALLCFLFNMIPTKQTLLLMGGTYLGKKAVNAVVTDEKIKKVDTIINLQLDKYIKELQGKEVK